MVESMLQAVSLLVLPLAITSLSLHHHEDNEIIPVARRRAVNRLLPLVTWAVNRLLKLVTWAVNRLFKLVTCAVNRLLNLLTWAVNRLFNFVTWAVNRLFKLVIWAVNRLLSLVTWYHHTHDTNPSKSWSLLQPYPECEGNSICGFLQVNHKVRDSVS